MLGRAAGLMHQKLEVLFTQSQYLALSLVTMRDTLNASVQVFSGGYAVTNMLLGDGARRIRLHGG